MSDLEYTVDVAAPSSLEALREWFHANKDTPECRLAMKHRALMAPAVAAELLARAPGDTDEERDLAFVFSLTQIASSLDMAAILLGGIQVAHLPPVPPAPVTQPEVVATSHVDVTPLVEVPAAEK